jgi:hypothetical protein
VGWGTLPWPKLLDRLAEKATSGVIRTDKSFTGSGAGFAVAQNSLYYDIEL